MEILKKKYHNYLTLTKYNDNFYTIDFSNPNVAYTLLSNDSLNGIQQKWDELLNIINEIVELDMNCGKEEIKIELERIHGKLKVDFNNLYIIRKEVL